MHDALKDWLRLRVEDAENADMSPDSILIETVFVGHVIIAANDFILREACLVYHKEEQGRGK